MLYWTWRGLASALSLAGIGYEQPSLSVFVPRTEDSHNSGTLNAALFNGSSIQDFEPDDVHVDEPWHANSI